jgi:spore germination protein YaaH
MKRFSFVGVLLLTFMMACSASCAGTKEAPEKTAPAKPQKISLVWQHKDDPNVDLSTLDKVPGVNVVSPVWYKVTGEYGLVQDNSVEGYVERAHQKGYQVWPLITNSFDPDLTHKVLQDPHSQGYVIEQLVAQAEKHGFDGINVDFENIYENDRDALTSFVQYLRRRTKDKGIVLSMDVTVPSDNPNWSRCYDRKALTKELDYLVLMTYDQYSRLSTVPGPTASFNWDEDRLKATLAKGIPPEKVVLGIPLYMRLWKAEAGSDKYQASTLDMLNADLLNQEKGKLPSWRREWLPEEKMFRCSYEENGAKYVFWQEDALSLYYKTRLVSRYSLAGTAAWRFGFETPDVWVLLEH